jgi:hypothetical protein
VRRYIADGQLDAVRLGRKTLRIKVDSIELLSTLGLSATGDERCPETRQERPDLAAPYSSYVPHRELLSKNSCNSSAQRVGDTGFEMSHDLRDRLFATRDRFG